MADLCEWLDRFAQDPDASMDEVARAAASEGALAALAWVESFAGRPIPLYGVQRLDDYRLARDPEQASDPEQPGGPEEPDEPEEPDDCVQIEGYALVGLEELAELEAEFEKALPVAEPWSVQDRGYAEADPWTDEEARRWLTILKTHPEAADSLAILDGVATALRELPELGQPWFADKVERPLLERAVAIVERAVARASADDERAANANAAAGVDAVAAVAARTHSPFHLPWIVLGNRPALRSLSRLCALCIAFGPAEEGLRLARRMLELNPADNHGWRATVINLELAAGRDAEALVLAQRYPDELTVDIAYGRALALFRLGRQEEATIALREGVDRLPLVPRYLATEGMRAPPLDDFTVTIGGKDQAWRYREDARALWLITPGAIDWLRKVAREAGGGGDRRVGGSKGAGGGKGKRER
jgi:tetratricopeptide (TPR) repeat protein